VQFSISFGSSVFPMSARPGILSSAGLRSFRLRLPEETRKGFEQIALRLGAAQKQPLDTFPENVKNYIDDVQKFATVVKRFIEQYGSNPHVREIISQLDTHMTLVRLMMELPSNMQNPVQRIHRQWQPQDFTPSVLAYIQTVEKLMDDTERVFGQPGANDYVGEEIMRQLQHLQDEAIRGKVIPYQAYHGQGHRRPDQGHRRPDQGHRRPDQGQRRPGRADQDKSWRSVNVEK
jgi:hypothetical protein